MLTYLQITQVEGAILELLLKKEQSDTVAGQCPSPVSLKIAPPYRVM
jgi:hypothetical protein